MVGTDHFFQTDGSNTFDISTMNSADGSNTFDISTMNSAETNSRL